MKQTSILIYLILFTNFYYSQDKTPLTKLPDLIPYNKSGLFGYCNQKQELEIESKFTDAEPFMEDYYLLNSYNEKVKKFGSNIYATVKIKNKLHRIDKTGKIVYTFKPSDFEVEMMSQINESKYKQFEMGSEIGLKLDSNIIIKAMYQEIICFKRYCEPPFIAKLKDKYGIIDVNNKVIVDFKYEKIINSKYESNAFLPLLKVEQDKNIFYVDLNGVEYRN